MEMGIADSRNENRHDVANLNNGINPILLDDFPTVEKATMVRYPYGNVTKVANSCSGKSCLDT